MTQTIQCWKMLQDREIVREVEDQLILIMIQRCRELKKVFKEKGKSLKK